jgi:hypothetical protein
VQHHSKLIGGEQGIRTRGAERLHHERAGLNVPWSLLRPYDLPAELLPSPCLVPIRLYDEN